MTRLLVAVLAFAMVPSLLAQERAEWPGRPRYPEGLLYISANGGATKYSGEFSDQSIGRGFLFKASYSIFPSLNLGLAAELGDTRYHRRARRNTVSTYEYQFGDENGVLRTTTYSSYYLALQFNFFPRAYLNGYVTVGGGVTFFTPEDYAKERVTVRPKNDNYAGAMIPVGLGADLFLTRWMALNVDFTYHVLFTDRFDAFPSAEVREEMPASASTDPVDEGNDGYFTLTLGVKFYLFENQDPDGDLLLNKDEERAGTDPYDPDTDGDGLTDYEEVARYHTNPLQRDTDGDGLNDYVELMKYRTDPLVQDTDGDGLSDADEVQKYNTNPLVADTDADGLPDGREVAIGTNPNLADSDRDGLTDGDEVLRYHTNPLQPDSDGDKLSDYEEVKTFGTDPNKPDTDGDGLTDAEEVFQDMTNPLAVDTDGDSLSDFAEIRQIGTNPLRRDTDEDGFNDNVDKCPLDPETYNGFEDDDGCPDQTQRGAIAGGGGKAPQRQTPVQPAATAAATPGYFLQRLDTVRMAEGQIITLFGVNFEVDKDVIRPESYPILDENAKLFSIFPKMVVEIRGHTDSDASDEYNLDLSDRRAKSVKRYLESIGIPSDRMTTRGFGESMPIAPNTDAIGKARNRRIEFYITSMGDRTGGELDRTPIDSTRQVRTK